MILYPIAALFLFCASSSAIRSKRINGSPVEEAKRLTSSLVILDDGVSWEVTQSSPRVKMFTIKKQHLL